MKSKYFKLLVGRYRWKRCVIETNSIIVGQFIIYLKNCKNYRHPSAYTEHNSKQLHIWNGRKLQITNTENVITITNAPNAYKGAKETNRLQPKQKQHSITTIDRT